ncbi:MAG TPA: rod shape-determining protein MreD [Actinomycetales bacterium]|nr:rod shape-determining protein MreD [Actinomycetales bacterium]
MTGPRVVLTVVVLLVAVLVDATALASVQVAGTPADLVVLVVVASALSGGSVQGATVGLLGGLLADLTPPGAGLLGAGALAYAAAGAVAGRWARPGGRSTDRPLVLVLLAAGLAGFVARAVHGFFALGGTGVEQALVSCVVAALLAVVLGAVVLPALTALDRRVAEELP